MDILMLLNRRGFGRSPCKDYECPAKDCPRKKKGFYPVPPQCPDHGLTMRKEKK